MARLHPQEKQSSRPTWVVLAGSRPPHRLGAVVHRPSDRACRHLRARLSQARRQLPGQDPCCPLMKAGNPGLCKWPSEHSVAALKSSQQKSGMKGAGLWQQEAALNPRSGERAVPGTARPGWSSSLDHWRGQSV